MASTDKGQPPPLSPTNNQAQPPQPASGPVDQKPTAFSAWTILKTHACNLDCSSPSYVRNAQWECGDCVQNNTFQRNCNFSLANLIGRCVTEFFRFAILGHFRRELYESILPNLENG